jgi:hypothetical protein
MTTRRILLAVALVLLVLTVPWFIGERAFQSHTVAVDPHGTALPAQRQVQLSRVMPSPSRADGLHAKLVTGTMPTAATQATVLSDEECQPDARGVSHCLNRLRLRDGSEIEIRHPHVMATVACLAPGEQVRLVPTLRA